MSDIDKLRTSMINNNIDDLKTAISEDNIDVNRLFPKIEMNLLHLAAKYGSVQIIELLKYDYNADIGRLGNMGNNLLHYAAAGGNFEVVKYLIESQNFDPESKTNGYQTPVSFATYEKQLKVLKYLLEKCGADPNSEEFNGLPSLHIAASMPAIEITQYLLNLRDGEGLPRVNVNAESDEGETPLMLTQRARKQQLLRDHGAKEKGEAEDLRQLANDSQSTHNTRVTESVSASVERLKERFGSNSFEEFEDFKAYMQDKDRVIEELENAGCSDAENIYNIAMDRFDEVTQSSWFTHMASGYTDFKTVLGLVWAALKDTQNPHPEIGIDREDQNLEAERHSSLVKVFTTMGGICPEGRFNQIVEAADRMHADIEINRLARVAEGGRLSRDFLRANQDNLLQKTFDKLPETPKKLILNNYNVTEITPEKFNRMAQLVIGAAKQSLNELVPVREFAPNELIVLEEFMEEEAQFITHVSHEDKESYIDPENQEAMALKKAHDAELEKLQNAAVFNKIKQAIDNNDPGELRENAAKLTDINTADEGGNTALQMVVAGSHDNPALIKVLREASDGIDLNQLTGSGKSALSAAITEELTEIAAELIACRAEVNSAEGMSSKTPLHYAAENGNLNIAEKLIEAGADLEAKTSNWMIWKSYTPLHLAAYAKDEQMYELLINNGADQHATDNSGKTALKLARESGLALELDQPTEEDEARSEGSTEYESFEVAEAVPDNLQITANEFAGSTQSEASSERLDTGTDALGSLPEQPYEHQDEA